jgi:hypothetical protein
MATPATPAVVAPVKQSWLKRFGHEVLVILGVVAKDVAPLEKIAVPVAEALLPAFAPAIAAGAGIFEKLLEMITTVEGTFAAVGQASNGPAKLQAVLAGIGPILDDYVQYHFPGSAAILKAEAYLASKTGLVNAVVAFLNNLEAGMVAAVPGSSAVAAAAAAQAAVAAAKPA